jgi:hypothetical protein
MERYVDEESVRGQRSERTSRRALARQAIIQCSCDSKRRNKLVDLLLILHQVTNGVGVTQRGKERLVEARTVRTWTHQ